MTNEKRNENQAVTILLVEDDPGHAELVKLNLKRGGIDNELIHFENGQKVLEFLAQHKSDKKYLVILDINMPGINGLQVLNKLKSNDTTRNIPIIILTTATEQREADYCYELGCNVFITKPVDYETFCEAIHELGAFLKIAKISGSKKSDRTEQNQYVVYY
ncbi:MAG TPA: response regulator [Gammaproteobacteria bacterium]|nr:response regulator [Gammaproteobacteria bacterium]